MGVSHARSNLFRATTALIALVAGEPALAQEVRSPTAQADPSDQTGDIIVTAQKREATLARTPIAMSALNGEDLAKRGISTLDEALRAATGVHVEAISQGGQVFIRGVGSSIDPQFADPAVALMTDGVYNGRTEGITGDGFDIDRVEVLRGPQGTLYGRNATGGVVNVITRAPKLDGFSGYARLQVGNYDSIRGEAAVNVPIVVDHVAMRLAGFKTKRDGFIGRGNWDLDAYGFRGSLLLEPSPGFRVLARAEVYDEDDAGIQSVAVPGSAGKLTFPPAIFYTNFDPALPASALIPRLPNGWDSDQPNDVWSSSPEFPAGRHKIHSELYSLQIEADLGFANLTVLPAYSTHDTLLESQYFFGNLTGPYQAQTPASTYKSVETRLASKAGAPFEWIVGAYYLSNTNSPLTVAQGPFTQVVTRDPSKTLAFFGEAKVPLSSTFRLVGGLRYSRDNNGNSNRITATGFDSGPIDFSQKVSSTTFKFGFEYDAGTTGLLYAHVASGFKQGGISMTVPAQTFKPERLLDYEIGYKNDRLLDGRASLFASFFYYQYSDYQLASNTTLQLGNTGEAGSFFLVGNAGNSRIFGLEIEPSYRVTDDDRVRASFTWLKTRYGAYILPNNPYVNQGDFQLEGRQMANSPEFTASFGYEHVWRLSTGAKLTAGGNIRYSSSYYASPEQYLPGAYQKAFTRSDAQLRYQPSSGAWSIGAYVQNIENKAQTTYVYPAYRRFVSQPRTYGISAEINF